VDTEGEGSPVYVLSVEERAPRAWCARSFLFKLSNGSEVLIQVDSYLVDDPANHGFIGRSIAETIREKTTGQSQSYDKEGNKVPE
jgi:hypothetical protein